MTKTSRGGGFGTWDTCSAPSSCPKVFPIPFPMTTSPTNCGTRLRTQLDANSKKWRLFADGLNDGALCLELCAPHAAALVAGVASSTVVTAVLCVAGAAKAVVGMAGGATRAALTQHQSRRGNLADVSAKDGSQETLVNLAALLASLWLLPLVAQSPTWTWLAFLLFTGLHLAANYQAVKSVRMDTLNRTRLLLLLQQFAADKTILSVARANRIEPVVMGFVPSDRSICGYEIRLGLSARDLGHAELRWALSAYRSKQFAVVADEQQHVLHVLLRDDCSAGDILEAYHHAVLSALTASGKISWMDGSRRRADAALLETLQQDQWPEFRRALAEKGWNTNHTLLAAGEWRATWPSTSATSS